MFACNGGTRVGLGSAVVGDGVVRTGHGQGAGRHAHAGARCAQGVVVAAQAAVAAAAQAQAREAAQGLVVLYVGAAQVAGVAQARDREGLAEHTGGGEVLACVSGARIVDARAAQAQVGLVDHQMGLRRQGGVESTAADVGVGVGAHVAASVACSARQTLDHVSCHHRKLVAVDAAVELGRASVCGTQQGVEGGVVGIGVAVGLAHVVERDRETGPCVASEKHLCIVIDTATHRCHEVVAGRAVVSRVELRVERLAGALVIQVVEIAAQVVELTCVTGLARVNIGRACAVLRDAVATQGEHLSAGACASGQVAARSHDHGARAMVVNLGHRQVAIAQGLDQDAFVAVLGDAQAGVEVDAAPVCAHHHLTGGAGMPNHVAEIRDLGDQMTVDSFDVGGALGRVVLDVDAVQGHRGTVRGAFEVDRGLRLSPTAGAGDQGIAMQIDAVVVGACAVQCHAACAGHAAGVGVDAHAALRSHTRQAHIASAGQGAGRIFDAVSVAAAIGRAAQRDIMAADIALDPNTDIARGGGRQVHVARAVCRDPRHAVDRVNGQSPLGVVQGDVAVVGGHRTEGDGSAVGDVDVAGGRCGHTACDRCVAHHHLARAGAGQEASSAVGVDGACAVDVAAAQLDQGIG